MTRPKLCLRSIRNCSRPRIGHHPETAGHQQHVLADESLDREPVAERPPQAHFVAFMHVVEEVIREHAGTADGQLEDSRARVGADGREKGPSPTPSTDSSTNWPGRQANRFASSGSEKRRSKSRTSAINSWIRITRAGAGW